jgi:hypothetical protein
MNAFMIVLKMVTCLHELYLYTLIVCETSVIFCYYYHLWQLSAKQLSQRSKLKWMGQIF